MRTLWLDLRYSARMLRRDSVTTTIIVLTLALGIGANTAIFSILQQVLLQRLPLPHPEQLVLLYGPGPKTGHVSSDEVGPDARAVSFSYPMYEDLRDRNTVFSGLAAKSDYPVSITFRGGTERAQAEVVSGNYFDTLEVQPAIGRMIVQEDTASGGNPVVVLGYGYWQRRFGGSPGILNDHVRVNDELLTVVGVAPQGFNGFQFGLIPDVYIPITMKARITPGWNGLKDHNDYWVRLVARLNPGVSRAQATAEIAVTYHALVAEEIPLNSGLSEREKKEFSEKPLVLRDGARGRPLLENNTKPGLTALMGMVSLVLLATCVNVAGLLTARGAARRKELGVRLSLGASRRRLITQMLIESVPISALGTALGLVFAKLMSMALVRFASTNYIADGLSTTLNLPVLAFTAALALISAVLFGIVPAWSVAQFDLLSALSGQDKDLKVGSQPLRLRRILVVSQVTMALLLVTGAWGLTKSLYNLKHVDLGFQPDHLLQFSVAPILNGYDNTRSLGLYRELEQRLGAVPGIVSFSGTARALLSEQNHASNVTVEGMPEDFSLARHVMNNAIGPGHFANMRIPLLSGREFTPHDGLDGPKVAIINETMARQFFPNTHPIGRHLKFGGGDKPPDIEVVGLVTDSHHSDVKEEVKAFVYVPYMQELKLDSMTYYVRTANDPAALVGAIRQVVGKLDDSLPIYDVRTVKEQIDHRLSNEELLAILALAFGSLAALLTAMGIYGLLTYLVTQRRREFGLRMALGAEAADIRRMLFSEMAVLVGAGVAIGIPLMYVLANSLTSLLYDVRAFGVATVGISLVVLGFVSTIATVIPSRQATRIDPIAALRHD